jgi:hypothetical protein
MRRVGLRPFFASVLLGAMSCGAGDAVPSAPPVDAPLPATDTMATSEGGAAAPSLDPAPVMICPNDGTWAQCPVDRSNAQGYQSPAVPASYETQDPRSAPTTVGTVGNLAGHANDGLVFSDVAEALPTEAGGSNPGYLCASGSGGYGPCPDALGLPSVPGTVVATALGNLDLDATPDLLIVAIETSGSFYEEARRVFSEGVPLAMRLHVSSQAWREGDALPHWEDRSASLGLGTPFAVDCVPTNLQMFDLDLDGDAEVILGGRGCHPWVFAWEDQGLVRKEGWLPSGMTASNSGIFPGPALDGRLLVHAMDRSGFDTNPQDPTLSSCWSGVATGPTSLWTAFLCPSLGGSPMGFASVDLDRDGQFEAASSDVGADRVCTNTLVSMGIPSCFDSTASLPPASRQTLAGPQRPNVSWSVTSTTQGNTVCVYYLEGYEHAREDERLPSGMQPPPEGLQSDVPWTAWPQELHVFCTEDGGATWAPVHNPVTDAPVQERGHVLFDPGTACPGLLTLPVGLTAMRVVSTPCTAGTQGITFYNRHGQAAYGAHVLLHRTDGSRQAQMIVANGGEQGFGPPVAFIDPTVEQLEVHWTDQTVTTVTRDTTTGAFPHTVRPTSASSLPP